MYIKHIEYIQSSEKSMLTRDRSKLVPRMVVNESESLTHMISKLLANFKILSLLGAMSLKLMIKF